jgi:hypothetical protein
MSNEYEVTLTESDVDAKEFIINTVSLENQIGFVYVVWNSVRKYDSGVFFAVIETTVDKKEITRKMTNKKLRLRYPSDKSSVIFESRNSEYKMRWNRVHSFKTCLETTEGIKIARDKVMINADSLLVMSKEDDSFCFVGSHEELVSAIEKYNQYMNQPDIVIDHECVEVNLHS